MNAGEGGDDEVGSEGAGEIDPGAATRGTERDIDLDDFEGWVIERAVLNDDVAGREIAAGFVRMFGAFVSNEVRPVLRRVDEAGGEPQLLVNGLAALLRATADSIEFPLDHPRSGTTTDEEG